VIEQRYYPQPNTPQRCGLMPAATPPAWRLFTPSFAEPWDGFKRVYPRYDRRSYAGLVAPMLGGGNPEQMGSIASRGGHGGEGAHRVAMSCQAALGLRCAKVSVAPWGSPGRQRLHAGVLYRHSVLTVPELLRKIGYQQAQAVLRPFMRGGGRCLEAVGSRVRGCPLQGGSIVVIPTHGRPGHDNPHRHSIATSGGGEPQAPPWLHLDSIPYTLLRQPWPWPLLTRLRQTVKPPAIRRLVDTGYTRSRAGLVPNVPTGDVPARYPS
jgi:hypothetical protein